MAPPKLSDAQIKRIIVEGDSHLLVESAEAYGKFLKQNGLSTSQIRAVFGSVRRISGGWRSSDRATKLRQILLLKPRLRYQSARSRQVAPLADLLAPAIDHVCAAEDDKVLETRFKNFEDLFESVLAYHTAAGGR